MEKTYIFANAVNINHNHQNNMKNTRFYTAAMVLAFSSMLFSCKGNADTNDPSVRISEKDVISLEGTFDDNFLESWEYILLDEDNDDALLADAAEIMYDDGLFFVFSGIYGGTKSVIKVFDESGRYLNDIGHAGRARGEYLHIFNFALNTVENEVIIHDDLCLKRYSYNGDFLGQTSIGLCQPGSGFYGENYVKCLSDGSVMVSGGLSILPSYDLYLIGPDGVNSAFFELNDYCQYCDMDPMQYIKMAGDMPGILLTSCASDISTDVTYFMRNFDNHIYRYDGDSVQCLANMDFIPEIPLKVKKGFKVGESIDEEYENSIPMATFDMKDHMLIIYRNGAYVYDKSTSEMYYTAFDSLGVSFPYMMGRTTVCGNMIIGALNSWNIQEILDQMDSPDYDHRYTPEMEAFYRKLRDKENPVIVVAHYRNSLTE